jgi:predicted phage-related endonuclease
MNNETLLNTIHEYNEYSKMLSEVEAIKTNLADILKSYMIEAGQDTLTVGDYKLSYISVSRSDLDRKRLEAENNGIYNQYLKETTYKRFSVV